MNRPFRILLTGLLSWLVPFLVSIPLYPQGQPVLDLQVTKSILIVVGGLVGAILALWYFRGVKAGFTREGAVLGTAWFALNCALDILVLVGLMHGMDLSTWAGQIGVRYLLMPIMITAMGAAADIRARP